MRSVEVPESEQGVQGPHPRHRQPPSESTREGTQPPPVSWWGRAGLGAVAGAVGTGTLAVMERLERRWLGHLPVFAARNIAARLGVMRTGRLGPVPCAACLRWPYGMALGAGLAAFNLLARGSLPAAALRAGGLILGAELAALPRVGATPPLSRWRPAERAVMALHTTSFGVGAVLAYRTLVRAIAHFSTKARSMTY
jgi:hypothetical protein